MAEENKELPKMRTFKTDTEVFMREKKISELDIARSAYMKRDIEAAAAQEPVSYRKIILVGIVLAVILVFGYLAFTFLPKTMMLGPATKETKATAPFLFVDGEKIVSASEANPGMLADTLTEERKKNLRFDTVIYASISLASRSGEVKFSSAQDFIKLMQWKAPGTLLENILKEFNTLLIYGKNSNDISVIFKIKNLEQTLSALLAWEPTMWFDWKPFLNAEDINNISKFKFADDIVKNQDARVLKNKEGKIILGYAIFNKELLVISTSRDGLEAALDRLITLPPR